MLTKHKWLNYLVAAALVGIVVSAVFRTLTPGSPKIPATDVVTQNQDQTAGEFKGVVFVGSQPELPEKLSVFQIEIQDRPEQEIIQQLVEEYGLQRHVSRETLWASQSHTLSFNPQENQITLAQIPKADSGQTRPKVSLEPALKAAEEFVTKVLPSKNLRSFSNDAEYLTGTYHLASASSEEATLVEIPFSYQVDNYPVFVEKQEGWPITIMVDGNEEIIKAVFTTKAYDFKKTFAARVLTIEEALENINEKNLGSLISVYQKQFEPISLAKISSGKLEAVVVEYRIDEDAQLSYPVYKFTGEFVSSADNSFRGQLLTPAVPAESIE